jgi:hypothetical protein
LGCDNMNSIFKNDEKLWVLYAKSVGMTYGDNLHRGR